MREGNVPKKHYYFGSTRVNRKKSQRIKIEIVDKVMDDLRMGPGDYIPTTDADRQALMDLGRLIQYIETVPSDKEST